MNTICKIDRMVFMGPGFLPALGRGTTGIFV